MGVVVVWAGQPSHARESWLAHASHLPNIPYLSCLLVLVPCLLLEAPSCSSLVGLSGPQDHFGCKWLPWGSPVRAPLATPVALPRAFMPISSPRIRVQLCTAAYSCTSSDSFQSLAAIASEERIRQVQKRSSIKEKSHQVSYLALLLSESIVVLHRSQNFL